MSDQSEHGHEFPNVGARTLHDISEGVTVRPGDTLVLRLDPDRHDENTVATLKADAEALESLAGIRVVMLLAHGQLAAVPAAQPDPRPLVEHTAPGTRDELLEVYPDMGTKIETPEDSEAIANANLRRAGRAPLPASVPFSRMNLGGGQ